VIAYAPNGRLDPDGDAG